MKSEDLIITERAQVLIGKTGHRIYFEREGSGPACGVLNLKLTGDDANMLMAEPQLFAGSVLGANRDYLPTFYTISPSSLFVDDIDAAAETFSTLSTGAYSVSAPASSLPVNGFWQKSKYAVLLMKDQILAGSDIACAILLQDLSIDDLKNGCSAEVMLKGQVVNPNALYFHRSVAKTEQAREIKYNQLRESGIDVITNKGSSTATSEGLSNKKPMKPWS